MIGMSKYPASFCQVSAKYWGDVRRLGSVRTGILWGFSWNRALH